MEVVLDEATSSAVAMAQTLKGNETAPVARAAVSPEAMDAEDLRSVQRAEAMHAAEEARSLAKSGGHARGGGDFPRTLGEAFASIPRRRGVDEETAAARTAPTSSSTN
eukprot:8059480-Heterocapsa_arctica.AAC.1